MYNKLVKEFIRNPRDIHTSPLVRKPYNWFHVFVEKGKLYVEPAHHNYPKCTLKRRSLIEKECDKILEIYHRRLKGEKISKEAQDVTHSQVYWYGIFAELNL